VGYGREGEGGREDSYASDIDIRCWSSEAGMCIESVDWA
jgi:hypothetical protein